MLMRIYKKSSKVRLSVINANGIHLQAKTVGVLYYFNLFGLMPLNHLNHSAAFYDYIPILLAPSLYICAFVMTNYDTYAVKNLDGCKSICHLANTLIIHLGIFVYSSNFLFVLLRLKGFYPKFYRRLAEIDRGLDECSAKEESTRRKAFPVKQATTFVALFAVFGYCLYFDASFLIKHFGNYFFFGYMAVTFPLLSTSIVQGQFISLVHEISKRFSKLNDVVGVINKECDLATRTLRIFDIETELDDLNGGKPLQVMRHRKFMLPDVSEDEEDFKKKDTVKSKTSESKLIKLFALHDQLLSLSVYTNNAFAPQIVPYMVVCFVITIFGIFLETKVILVVSGQNDFLDYISFLYVLWSVSTIMVAYLVLRLCCSTITQSKDTAMLVHEIMQKKPHFMLGSELYYNKMKAFTLQFLHWEGFFQFNGIGLFTLDYTFIFSTVSAATSYLIVLLQFDMTTILRSEGFVIQ